MTEPTVPIVPGAAAVPPTPTALPQKITASSWILLALVLTCPVLFVVGLVTNSIGGSGSGSSDTMAMAACREFVKDRLVAPSTADFSGLSAIGGARGQWTVKGAVDAENRLGVPIRMDFTCVVEHNGGDWLLIRMSGLNG